MGIGAVVGIDGIGNMILKSSNNIVNIIIFPKLKK